MSTWFSGISKHHRILRKNIFVWCLIYGVVFLVLILRLFWLQVVQHDYYTKVGNRYRYREVELPATRGRLLDRNYTVLALDDEQQSLFVDPSLCTYPGATAADRSAYTQFIAHELAPVIQQPEEEILATLNRQLSFVWVKRHLTPKMVSELQSVQLPGIAVRVDGARYRVGIDLSHGVPNPDILAPLATLLKLPQEEVSAQLGMAATPKDQDAPVLPATGQRWVRGIYHAGVKEAIEELHLPNILYTKAGLDYSLGVDPRVYAEDDAAITATQAAVVLAPILQMSEEAVARRLLFRPRFAWLKRGLTRQMTDQVMQLQGTMFVVKSGLLSPVPTEEQRDVAPLQEAADRLYSMLNDPKAPERISRDEIVRRLQPGQPPGPLAIKLINGRPVVNIHRRLFTQPIPGVVYGLPGVSLQAERRRRYQYNTMASATLGFTDSTRHGAFGLEQSQDKTLAGVDGREKKEIDTRRVTIPERSQRTEPKDGMDVVTTLDRDIQLAADAALAKAVADSHAAGGQCVVMDSNTGEILALSNYPQWDANAPGKTALPLVNASVSHFYEPGSTFKLMAVMAALEEGLIHDSTQITYCSGALGIGRRVVHEAHHAHGAVDAGRLLEQSCNIGAALLAMRLGETRFLHWCDKLGFGRLTGVEIKNESPGSLNRTNAHAKITLANMGFGQSLAVTPLQMVAAYSSVANGGEWVQPHLIKARLLPDGTRQETVVPRRRVCSPATAKLIRGYLERVVTKGTGGSAAIPGYRVAGKTGTAQKAGEHGYGSGKAIGSFIGFVPADNPRFTILAIIDEPQGSHYGGVVAAPVFREVGLRALSFYNIPPSMKTPAGHRTP